MYISPFAQRLLEERGLLNVDIDQNFSDNSSPVDKYSLIISLNNLTDELISGLSELTEKLNDFDVPDEILSNLNEIYEKLITSKEIEKSLIYGMNKEGLEKVLLYHEKVQNELRNIKKGIKELVYKRLTRLLLPRDKTSMIYYRRLQNRIKKWSKEETLEYFLFFLDIISSFPGRTLREYLEFIDDKRKEVFRYFVYILKRNGYLALRIKRVSNRMRFEYYAGKDLSSLYNLLELSRKEVFRRQEDEEMRLFSKLRSFLQYQFF